MRRIELEAGDDDDDGTYTKSRSREKNHGNLHSSSSQLLAFSQYLSRQTLPVSVLAASGVFIWNALDTIGGEAIT